MSWDKVGGTGLWTEYVNEDTGETSLKEHKLKVVKQWCPKDAHDYRVTDMGKRLATCTKCKQELTFIIGKHQLEGDKVTVT